MFQQRDQLIRFHQIVNPGSQRGQFVDMIRELTMPWTATMVSKHEHEEELLNSDLMNIPVQIKGLMRVEDDA